MRTKARTRTNEEYHSLLSGDLSREPVMQRDQMLLRRRMLQIQSADRRKNGSELNVMNLINKARKPPQAVKSYHPAKL
jgi:hypothetical protein